MFQQLTVPRIYDRWRNYGRTRARWPSLWDGSLVLATIGPQVGGGTIARDFSGKNLHCSLVGTPTWGVASSKGSSFRTITMNGSTQYGAITNTAGIIPEGTASGQVISCSLWFARSATDRRTIIGNWEGTSSPVYSAGWTIEMSEANKVRLLISTTSFPFEIWDSTATVVTDTAWHHLFFSHIWGTGASFRVYLDGTSFGGSWTTGTGNGLSVAATADVRIGSNWYNGAFTPPWSGSLADIFAWSRWVTPAEISILARHPLAAYECRPLPRVFVPSAAPAAAKYWLWARQQRSQVIGGGVT